MIGCHRNETECIGLKETENPVKVNGFVG